MHRWKSLRSRRPFKNLRNVTRRAPDILTACISQGGERSCSNVERDLRDEKNGVLDGRGVKCIPSHLKETVAENKSGKADLDYRRKAWNLKKRACQGKFLSRWAEKRDSHCPTVTEKRDSHGKFLSRWTCSRGSMMNKSKGEKTGPTRGGGFQNAPSIYC